MNYVRNKIFQFLQGDREYHVDPDMHTSVCARRCDVAWVDDAVSPADCNNMRPRTRERVSV